MKELFILRAIPGAGKSTLAKSLVSTGGKHYEADMYFYDDEGNYNFSFEGLHKAHLWCQESVEKAMQHEISRVVVSNTSTTEKELKPYMELAERYGYMVHSLIVENRHGGVNSHNVPDEVLDKMENRFSVKLR